MNRYDYIKKHTDNRYQFIKELAQGGQGSLSLWKDLQNNNVVVFKTCHNLHSDLNLKDRLRREAAIMKEFSNDNLVAHLNFFDADPPVLVMEYIEGKDLFQFIKNTGKIEWQEAVRIIVDVIKALRCLHQKNIIHRDIKPHNILRSENGDIKLCDFGIAKSQASFVEALTIFEKCLTEEGCLPRSALYAPPEYYDAPDKIDERFDIYSLGITLYQMLSGEHPHVKNGQLNMASLFRGIYSSLKDSCSSIPSELENIVNKMIACDVEERYMNVVAIEDDLNKLLYNTITEFEYTTTDPLVSLEEKVANVSLWAREEFVEEPEIADLQYISELEISLEKNIILATRRDIAEKVSFKYALQIGDWEKAKYWSKKLYGENNVLGKHLNAVNLREKKGCRISPDWMRKQKEATRKKIWEKKTPQTFRCRVTRKIFTREDVIANKVFFMPACVSTKAILKESRDWLGGYKLSKLKVGGDILGSFYLAISEQDQPFLVHEVPLMRFGSGKQDTVKQIIKRYKRGIKLAHKISGAPWIVSIQNPIPIEQKDATYFLLDYKPARQLPFYLKSMSKEFCMEKAYILLEIARALEVLYVSGAVHRYLTPHKIEIDFYGNVQVGGFTLAKFESGQDTAPQQDWVELSMEQSGGGNLGNPYYMSPEHLEHGLLEANHQSDLWSFGAIAYQLISSYNVFPVTKADILDARRRKEAILPLKEICPQISATWSTIVMKCLEFNPKNRYLNATELVGDILKAIGDS